MKSSIYELIPQISTIFSLFAFFALLYYTLHYKKLNRSSEMIEMAEVKDRQVLIDRVLREQDIELPAGEELTAQQRFELTRQKLNHRASADKSKIYALMVAILLGAVLLSFGIYANSNTPVANIPGKYTGETTSGELPGDRADQPDVVDINGQEVSYSAPVPPPPKPNPAALRLSWNSEHCQRAEAGNNGSVFRKAGSGQGYSAGCLSRNFIPGGAAGSIRVNVSDLEDQLVFGLAKLNTSTGWETIDFAFGQQVTTEGKRQMNVFVSDNNDDLKDNNKANFNPDSEEYLEIKKSAQGEVTFYRNGKLVYTADEVADSDLFIDVSLYRADTSGVRKLKLTGNWQLR